MRTVTVTFVLLLTLSLLLIIETNPHERRTNSVLRDQMYDYLLENKREDALYQRRKEFEKQILRRMGQIFDHEEMSDDDDNYERPMTRRKAVGLGDNPFK